MACEDQVKELERLLDKQNAESHKEQHDYERAIEMLNDERDILLEEIQKLKSDIAKLQTSRSGRGEG